MSASHAPEPAAPAPDLDAVGDARPTVVLIGPRPDSHGGVGATIRAIAESTLDETFHIVVLPTYRDGSALAKVWQAAYGLCLLAVLLARGKVDVVHLHSSSGASFTRKAVALALARLGRCGTVFHVHGGAFKAVLANRSPRGWLRRRTLLWALEHADAVVALTPGWREEIEASARVRRLRVVPNAPDLPALPCRRVARPQPRTVLYLGHLYREKGVFELVDAFALVAAERPGLNLILAGEGSDAKALRRHVEAAGVADLVAMPGWVPAGEKVRLFEEAACLALPSYHEGLPLVVLEAMVAEVPVVATAVGGIPEVARDGVEALLVPPRDVAALAEAIARVVGDEELASALTRAARSRARRWFAPDALPRRVGEIYSEVLSR